MKSIIARATLVAVSICLLVGFTATRLHAGEYFIYQDPSQQMEPKPWERTDLLQSARQDDPLGGASWLVLHERLTAQSEREAWHEGMERPRRQRTIVLLVLGTLATVFWV